ncbi:protein CIST1-like [Pantherophis guttatus]|uniref:Protein CIST1-like n=1 Tax=Pantherophis guttatus TaxID=94885 RepID=A0A6P9DR71_PANGU|nr:protein CIST1-like [Pantherophis guttatus]
MALGVLFLLVAFTQDSLSASSAPSLLETSTTITGTAALTVSDTTPGRADVTSKAASSPVPQSTRATSSTTKTNDSTTNWSTVSSPTGSKEPLTTTQTVESINGSTSAGPLSPEPAFSAKPGLVVVICLFVFVLVIVAVVVLIKCCRPKEPAFKKLEEVPMGKVTEDSPFARFPPK